MARFDSVQSAEAADGLRAGFAPAASSWLHPLGGILRKPADDRAQPNQSARNEKMRAQKQTCARFPKNFPWAFRRIFFCFQPAHLQGVASAANFNGKISERSAVSRSY